MVRSWMLNQGAGRVWETVLVTRWAREYSLEDRVALSFKTSPPDKVFVGAGDKCIDEDNEHNQELRRERM